MNATYGRSLRTGKTRPVMRRKFSYRRCSARQADAGFWEQFENNFYHGHVFSDKTGMVADGHVLFHA